MPHAESKELTDQGYRFGAFEVWFRSSVLLRDGVRCRIQELPFQMLCMLLEHPGETVSKESLGQRLWGNETFVEVDKSLYVVAAKLRSALDDDAANPLYIKTVSGRGYRFIGDATPISQLDPEPAATREPAAFDVEVPGSFRPAALPRYARWGVGASVVLLAALAFALYLYSHRRLASGHDGIVLGGFTNSTGNSDLDGVLSAPARLKLQESPYLDVLPEQTFRALVKDPDTAVLADQIRACAALHAQLLLTGQLLPLGQKYRVELSAWNCSTGKLLTKQQADADSPMAILAALDSATLSMRRRLGEDDATLQKYNVPSVQATTASLAALKAFNLGEVRRSQGLTGDSIASYKLAVDLDPQFALAYARLGIAYTNTRQPSLSRQYYDKAFELRSRATDRDRLYIVTHYYSFSTGEINRAIEDYELWRTLYPRDLIPANNLAVAYLQVGQPQRAIGLASKAIQLNPTAKFPYAMLAEAYLRTGAYDKASALCNDPVQSKTDFIGFHEVCFQLSSVQADEAGMERQLRWARGNPQESILLTDAAWVAMRQGKVAEARRLMAAAQQNALQNHLPESAADIQLDKANAEADLGLTREAQADARSALAALGSGSAAAEQAFAALAFARAGDAPDAEIQVARAAAQAPLDTILNSAVLASARATLQLQKHDTKGALRTMMTVRPLDFCENMELSPPYYRGLAYLAEQQFPSAIEEFQKVIDHRSLAPNSIYIALAQLQMGRALELEGKKTEAMDAYNKCETAWKGADAGFPPLQTLHSFERELNRLAAVRPISASSFRH